ncbi:MAG: 4-hydroxyphenyl-beta-ketoacyl-CoA hydrolase [Acidimicrobiia bacterium]|nr:MAG: 4-hydroxyphenyl-beta-ketoacyl-CoA hydrolase [Acidimicrobiia bacterium]
MKPFIDFHVHPPVEEFIDGPVAPFDVGLDLLGVDEVAEHYRERDGRAVILGLDTESTTRHRPFSSEDVATVVAAHPEVFVGFGSVDPARGAKAVAGIHGAARLGLAGLAFDPVVQAFDPAERSTLTLWANASDHGLIVLFHTGDTRLGRGLPGGGGLRLAHGDPRWVDVVASLYPDLRIVLAHNGALWREEALAVAAHKPNVWLSLIGTSAAEYAVLFDDALSPLDSNRCLFGSGWALADLDGQLAGWKSIDEHVRQRVLHDNAAELLGL